MEKVLQNFKFEYLHRDEGNYKLFGSVYLGNQNKISLNDAKIQIREKLIDGEYFYPQDLGIGIFTEHLNLLVPFDGWYEFEEISKVPKREIDLEFEVFIRRLNCA